MTELDHALSRIGTSQAAIPADPRIVTFKAFVEGAPLPTEWPAVAVEDVALLQYTGGTTGEPKGAMLSHRNLIANTLQCRAWTGTAATAELERVLTPLPLYHIFSLTANLLVALAFGAGHLPLAASLHILTPELVVILIGLNAFVALGFGYLYWSRGLEAAMLAPNAEVSMFPWKEPKERIPLAIRQIRSLRMSAT